MSVWEFFVWFFWFYIVISCISIFIRVIIDVFRDPELSGWAKALWLLFLVFLPFLGAFIYVIVRGRDMGRRGMTASREAEERIDDDIRSAATSTSAVSDIETAKRLLDSGAVTPAEYDALKAKALRGTA
ncbi:SHOCT domain-containing protein [Compostimonas suwonensis]|uniref:Phospholipase D-like protein n=1 Tax=Compostimonas suwonensis TaxID=1048394 RepID=A0A2M9BYV0_9MICO|nr:SHOCT domain-containing protein [Compostimonas suwonensis]PJJ63263.1 phospholipase D-like protein [Compostimonas suwonensis]